MGKRDNRAVSTPQATFRAYAHRGGADEAPENSLAAFTHAWDLGFHHLETDIRPTRDGVAVLHHDASWERTTTGNGVVREHTWAQVKSLRQADGTAPLRLEELLEAFPDAHVTLDVKESGSVVALVDAVRRCRASARICVGSFSARRLQHARRLLPSDTEFSAHPWEILRMRALPRATLPARVRRLQIPERALGIRFTESDFIARAHARGHAVDVWTVNDPARMGHLIDLGVDGIMTDAPSELRRVLLERGIWAAVR